jgi:hypothetical protein
METINSQVSRIVKDVSTTVILDNCREFIICGEITDGILNFESIGVVFYQTSEFDLLDEDLKYKIRIIAFNELRRLI